MSTDVDTLVEMGFDRNRSQRALHKTQFKGLQQAIDWMINHENDPDIDDPFEVAPGNVLGKASDPTNGQPMEVDQQGEGGADGEKTQASNVPEQALSLKCDDCGKLLRTEDDVRLHAARTGHENFSESSEEIKPLTAEEKQEQMAKLQEKIKQKREEKLEKEKQEAIEREKMRRRTGKEMGGARQKFQEAEMRKNAELRRKEREEEKLAKKKVLEKIEQDKQNRKAKNAKVTSPSAQPTPAPASIPQPAVQPVKKEYNTCRIQVTLTNGQRLTQTFESKEQLANVRLYVQLNRTDGDGPFALMTSFPKKIFAEEDMEKPLTELGLVPSASLIVTKPQ